MPDYNHGIFSLGIFHNILPDFPTGSVAAVVSLEFSSLLAAVIVLGLGKLFLFFCCCCSLKGYQGIHVRPRESCYSTLSNSSGVLTYAKLLFFSNETTFMLNWWPVERLG